LNKTVQDTSTLLGDLCTFMKISRWILLRMGNVSDKRSRENKTHILYSTNVFRKSYLLRDNAKNTVQADMPHMKI